MQTQMLTSVVWRLELGIRDAIAQLLATGRVDDVAATIANGGLGYVTTGGNLDPWLGQLETVVEQVRSEKIAIRREPTGPTPLLLDQMGG